jgi:transposase
MTPEQFVRFNTIPETRIFEIKTSPGYGLTFFLEKVSDFEICPKCAQKCFAAYDHRIVAIKDSPLRNANVLIIVRKRRFKCPRCEKVFTEPLQGVRKGARTTERFRKELSVAAMKYASLSDVQTDFACSTSTIYKVFYQHLARLKRQWSYPLPKVIGIDEHSFSREKSTHQIVWNTVIVDHTNARVYDLAQGRTQAEILPALRELPGLERVEVVTMDLSETFRGTIKEVMPQARIVADRFHILRCIDDRMKEEVRLLSDDIRKRDKFKIRNLFRKNWRLSKVSRISLENWLLAYRALAQLYKAKHEMFSAFNRRKPLQIRFDTFKRLMDTMAKSSHARVRSLRATFFKWKSEIAAAIELKWSNGRTEGFNCKAKLIKRRAYGFRNWENFRLKFWYSCFGQYS